MGTCFVLSSSGEHGVRIEYLQIVEPLTPQHNPNSEDYYGDNKVGEGSGGQKEECPEIWAIREQLTALELKLRD